MMYSNPGGGGVFDALQVFAFCWAAVPVNASQQGEPKRRPRQHLVVDDHGDYLAKDRGVRLSICRKPDPP